MYSYIKGKLEEITEDGIVLETGGIGYNIRIPESMREVLPQRGEIVKVYTYLQVKEDLFCLYGFLSREDLNFFKLLIGVNGIGPKGALGVLSALSCEELRYAIASEDEKMLSKAPGIGAKTAKRLIIELKDKISFTEEIEKEIERGREGSAVHTAKEEAILALVALGYQKAEARKAVSMTEISEQDTSDEILGNALKYLF